MYKLEEGLEETYKSTMAYLCALGGADGLAFHCSPHGNRGSELRSLSTYIALGIHKPRAPLEFIEALISLLPCQGEPTPSLHKLIEELQTWRKLRSEGTGSLQRSVVCLSSTHISNKCTMLLSGH